MHLPFELKTNPFTGIPKHIDNDDLGEIFPEDSEQEIVDKFNAIDKIRGVIHNAASDEIARSQLKQAKYYDSRHCGSKLSVGDKVLHYNHKAAQRQGDKTAPKWIGQLDDFLPDWIKPSQIPDSVDEVKKQFILTIDMEMGKMATLITFVDCFDN